MGTVPAKHDIACSKQTPLKQSLRGKRGGVTYPPFWAHLKKRQRQSACLAGVFRAFNGAIERPKEVAH